MAGSMPTMGTSNSLSARRRLACFSAVRSKAPKKPCTCSGLPLAENGMTNTRRFSRASSSTTSITSLASKWVVKASCTITTLLARCCSVSSASDVGVASAMPQARSCFFTLARESAGESLMPSPFCISCSIQRWPSAALYSGAILVNAGSINSVPPIT